MSAHQATSHDCKRPSHRLQPGKEKMPQMEVAPQHTQKWIGLNPTDNKQTSK